MKKLDKNHWSRKHKQCTACGTTKIPLGGKGKCKICYNYFWKKNNPEKVSISRKKYQKNNQKKISGYQKKYRKNNPEKIKSLSKARAEKQSLHNKRLLNALKKHGYTDKKITNFFGLKIS